MKNFIIDTNIFINDPECIVKFGSDNNVIIPMIVIEELDSFKNEDSGRAKAARQATRLIDEIVNDSDGDIYDGIKMQHGGKLFIDPNVPEIEFGETESRNLNDTLILQLAKNLTDDEKNNDVKLVTEDMNLRLRAQSLGINAEQYKNIKASSNDIYDDTRVIHCQPKEINQIYKNGKINVSEASFEDNLFENEGVMVKAGNKSALARCVDGELHVIKDKLVNNTFNINPRNAEQALALDLLLDDNIKLVCLSGKAGVGKTLLALAAGLQKTMNEVEDGEYIYDKVTVARPTVAMGNELGFTPGTVEEKMQPWMAPIYDNIEYLFKREGVHKKVRKNPAQNIQMFDKLDIMALTYIRGRSISNEFVIIDEVQNCSPHEIKTIVTRAAEGTKIVCTGDPYQIDNPYVDKESNGLSVLIDLMEGHDIFGYTNLVKGERSELAETASEVL